MTELQDAMPGESMEKLCATCGKTIPADQPFCNHCGTAWTAGTGAAAVDIAPPPALRPEPSVLTTPPAERKSSKALLVVGLLVLLAVIVFGGWLFLSRRVTSTSTSTTAVSTTATNVAPVHTAATSTEAAAPKPPGLQQSLIAHTKEVTALAFSPDGKTLFSGSNDGTVKSWDPSTGALKQTHEEPGTEIHAIAFAADSSFLALGAVGPNGHGYVALVSNTAAGLGPTSRTIPVDNVSGLALSPDHKTLAVGNGSSSVKLWDTSSGASRQTLEGQETFPNTVAFSPDGQTLAGGGVGYPVTIWDVATGQMKQLTGHASDIYKVAFSSDGQTLASASRDGTIKLWDLRTNSLIRTLGKDETNGDTVTFSNDGKTVAGTLSEDVKLWNVQTGSLEQTVRGEPGATSVAVLAFAPDGKTIATGCRDGSLKIWSVDRTH
jgi:WD domain, G-beta repeat